MDVAESKTVLAIDAVFKEESIMPEALKLLLVEDSEDDALLLERILQSGDYDLKILRVETAEQLTKALESEPWDIVISDYSLPNFDGLSALGIVRKVEPELPFIMISGKVSEEFAVEVMKAGAQDFISKSHLSRLVPAIRRELLDARERLARKQAEREVNRQNRQLQVLHETALGLINRVNLQELLKTLVSQAADMGRTEHVSLHLLNAETQAMEFVFGKGLCTNQAGLRIVKGRHMVGQVWASGEVVVVENYQEHMERLDIAENAWIQSAITLPLKRGDTVVGVMGLLYADKRRHISTGEIELLKQVAQLASLAIDSVLLYEEAQLEIKNRRAAEIALMEKQDELRDRNALLMTAWEQTVDVLSMTAEAKDPYTYGHQKRVSALVVKIAESMKLDKNVIVGLTMAAKIHDIGKIQIPGEILSKPGKLSPQEWELIKTHSQAGYSILASLKLPWDVAEIIYQHHERLDGSGYPRGLKNSEILMEARIIAIADVVEAMASHRPYRPSLGIDKALEEIRGNRDILYDSAAVDVCLKLFGEKGFMFPED